MNIGSMFQTWINVLTQPGEAVFEAERQKPNATLTTAIIWIIIAAVITAIFSAISSGISGLMGGGMASWQPLLEQMDLPPDVQSQLAEMMASSAGGGTILAAFCFSLILVPIGFLIGSGIYFLIAKLFGGTGSFEEQTYLLATFQAPIGIVSSVISIIPILGGCVSLLLFIYQLVLTYFAIRVVHRLGGGQAAVVAVAPVLIVLLCVICVSIVGVMIIAGAAANAS